MIKEWILVAALAGWSGVNDMTIIENLPQAQCVAMANEINTDGLAFAACFGPDGQEIKGDAL